MLKTKEQHSIHGAYAAPECKSIEVEPDAEVSALAIDDVLLEDWGTL